MKKRKKEKEKSKKKKKNIKVLLKTGICPFSASFLFKKKRRLTGVFKEKTQ